MKFCPTCKSKFPTDINYCPNDATKLVADPESGPSHSLIGMILDNRYRIISKLGEGGMGSVYASEHILLKKNVAIKVLRYDLARKEDVVRRFQNEAIAASRIGHENIIEVTDFGRTPDGSVYFVMEHLNGSALADIIQKSGSIPLRRAIPILLQITKALSAAHSQGIIHRDLKPENIVLIDKPDRKDFVKILDFGISKMLDTSDRAEKLTAMGMIVGTPEYMSPEQAAGMSVDKRTDIYSLGVIIYEMMTGRLPFLADNAIRILMMHQTEKPVRPRDINPEIHIGMEQIILKCMEKKPEDRFQDMSEITQALIQLLSASAKAPEPKKTIAFNPQAISPEQGNTPSPSQIFSAKPSEQPSAQTSSGIVSQEIPAVMPQPDNSTETRKTPTVSSGIAAANQPSNVRKTISGQIQQPGIVPEVSPQETNPVYTQPQVVQTEPDSAISHTPDGAHRFTGADKQAVVPQKPSSYEEEELLPVKPAGSKKAAIVVILLILLIAGGAGAYYILSGNKARTDNKPVQQITETKQEKPPVSEAKKEEVKEEKKEEDSPKAQETEERKEEKPSPDKETKTAKAADTVVISLTSEPENVEIYKGNVMLGVTPFQIKGRKNSSGEYVFRKAGYEPLKKKIVLNSSGEMKINLKRIEEKKQSPKKEKDPFEKIDDLKDLSF